MRRTTAFAVLLLPSMFASLFVATHAPATSHIVRIREVLAGVAGNPNVQLVELQMYVDGQQFVQLETLTIYDASAVPVGAFTFPEDLHHGENQASMLIATADAEAYFGIVADLLMTPVIIPSGGAVCFADYDCMAWVNFSGLVLRSPAGTPFNPAVGLVPSRSAERTITGGKDPVRLDAGDDTNDSAADFRPAVPTPTNNSGDTRKLLDDPMFVETQIRTSEGSPSLGVAVTRGRAVDPMSVLLATRDGTARAGQDYVPENRTLSFAAGEATKVFSIAIVEDGVVDAEEDFVIELSDEGVLLDVATVRICGNLPSAPRSLVSVPQEFGAVDVAWQEPTCEGDSPVREYVLYEGTPPSSSTVLATVPASQMGFRREGLAAGARRSYAVAAVNDVGASAKSGQVTITATNDTRAPTMAYGNAPDQVVVAGAPPVTGTASDDQAIAFVRAYAINTQGAIDREIPAECSGCGTPQASFTVTLSGSGLLPGIYVIRTIVEDSARPEPHAVAADLRVIFLS